MQQLVSSLIQYHSFQIVLLVVHAALFIVLLLVSIMTDETASYVTALFALLVATGGGILSFVFSNDAHREVENHKYVAVKNGKALEIESKSDLIKSHTFEIDSEDADHIYVKVNSLFWSNNYVIYKSDIDEVKN